MKPVRNPALVLAVLLALAIVPRGASAGDKDKKQETTYMPFSGLAATVVRPSGSHGVLTIDAGIDVPDPALRALASQDMPRLYDAYAMVLQGYGGGLIPGHVPDVDYIARQMQAATDRVLGRPGAKLLLCGVMVN
jgi:hypothetical protein